jgi:hypothetical protein
MSKTDTTYLRVGKIKAVTDLKTVGRKTVILLIELSGKPTLGNEDALYIRIEDGKQNNEGIDLTKSQDYDGV